MAHFSVGHLKGHGKLCFLDLRKLYLLPIPVLRIWMPKMASYALLRGNS